MSDDTTYRKRRVYGNARRVLADRAGARPDGLSYPASCAYCGAAGKVTWWSARGWVSFTDLEIDHVHPEVLGGTNDPDNLVLACRPCNRRKGHRLGWC